jgi:electron-transferring-flavoprotein dehydrogenase
MGEEHVSLGFVVGLHYADVELSAHDLLQEFKTHRLVRKILYRGERVAWGAKTITEGGLHSVPSRLNAPGLLIVGEGAGLVNVPRLKGVHYAIESGRLAAEAIVGALRRGEVAGRAGALDAYDTALRESYFWNDLDEVRNMRQAFDKLSSVFASGNRTRDDQPSHIRIQTKVPRDLAEMWHWMCPAQVYEVGEPDGDGTVSVQVNPSNCVQCGAISAKGGRLTPPEGGSGPEYTIT